MTAHNPIPLTFEAAFGQTMMLILSPISSAVGAFHSIIIFAAKIGTGNLPHNHDAISAGAYAISVPAHFQPHLGESAFGWRTLHERTQISATSESGTITTLEESRQENPLGDNVFYSLPPLTLLRTNPPPKFASSSKFKTIFAFLQLGYSVAQGYLQYESMIRAWGLASPFAIAIPYLYMSSINLVANLVQGSYSHVTILSPTTLANMRNHICTVSEEDRNGSAADTTADSDGADKMEAETSLPSTGNPPDQTRYSTQPEVELLFDEWLATNYPQIDVDNSVSLSRAIFLHYILVIVVLLLATGLVSGFQTSQCPFLLIVVLVDPVSQLLFAAAGRWVHRPRWMRKVIKSRTGVGSVMGVVWIMYLLGWVHAIGSLFEVYRST
jgi:hypothetical protein